MIYIIILALFNIWGIGGHRPPILAPDGGRWTWLHHQKAWSKDASYQIWHFLSQSEQLFSYLLYLLGYGSKEAHVNHGILLVSFGFKGAVASILI